MHKPFGTTLNLTFSLSRRWLRLGPGWAALAGVLSSGYPEPTFATLLQLASLWLLVDPILGTLWVMIGQQRLWQRIALADLPPAPSRGFLVPYAQPGSLAGRLTLATRRYRLWWQQTFWPVAGDQIVTIGVGLALALLISLALHQTIFWLAIITLILIALAGFGALEPVQGPLQSLVQFLLPWGMGLLLFPDPALVSLLLAFCFWAVYLGGLRLLVQRPGAIWLVVWGQLAALMLLLALRLPVGGVVVGVLLAAQLLLKTALPEPGDWLDKIQPYLVGSLLAAALALGRFVTG